MIPIIESVLFSSFLWPIIPHTKPTIPKINPKIIKPTDPKTIDKIPKTFDLSFFELDLFFS